MISRIHNIAAHLRNVSNARLAVTSIPLTKISWKLAIAMQDAGFFSNVVHGGPKPPPKHLLLGLPSINDEKVPLEHITRHNIASQQIWLGMKYWQGEPVIREISAISKPKRKVNLNVAELREVVRGRLRNNVEGLRAPGECLFLATNLGIFESRECIEKNVGGLVLLRVS